MRSFENENGREGHSGYHLLKVQIKDRNVKIDDRNVLFSLLEIVYTIETYDNRKTGTGQGDDYTTGCLLDYPYFKEHYKMITIDLINQQALDAKLTAIQRINFTGNLDRAWNTTIFFHYWRSKRNYFQSFRRNCKSVIIAFNKV